MGGKCVGSAESVGHCMIRQDLDVFMNHERGEKRLSASQVEPIFVCLLRWRGGQHQAS